MLIEFDKYYRYRKNSILSILKINLSLNRLFFEKFKKNIIEIDLNAVVASPIFY